MFALLHLAQRAYTLGFCFETTTLLLKTHETIAMGNKSGVALPQNSEGT